MQTRGAFCGQNMPTENSREEYLNRLNRVMNFIHANLGQPLSLSGLADVAGFSPFHFHRIFKSLVGETLGEYVQRARLEKSANLLLGSPGDTIINTALTCGFSSAAGYSRAFRAHFGVSPKQFRNQQISHPGKIISKTSKVLSGETNYTLDLGFADDSQESQTPLDIRMKTLPDMHVAYIRHIQGYRMAVPNSQIGQAFERVCRWASDRDLVDPNTLLIGIPYDNPDITPVDRRRYDACVTIPKEIIASQGAIGIQDIHGGKYAICRIDVGGSEVHRIGEIVDRLYGQWLPGSGYQADDKPPLEIYRATVGKPAGTWICMDYCIPVKSYSA
jgi:AraC family transcriptional regulator